MDAHRGRRNPEASRIGRLYDRLADLLRRRPGRLESFKEYYSEQEESERADTGQATTRSDQE